VQLVQRQVAAADDAAAGDSAQRVVGGPLEVDEEAHHRAFLAHVEDEVEDQPQQAEGEQAENEPVDQQADRRLLALQVEIGEELAVVDDHGGDNGAEHDHPQQDVAAVVAA